MNLPMIMSLGAAVVLVGTAAAQKPPPIRPIGPIVRLDGAPGERVDGDSSE